MRVKVIFLFLSVSLCLFADDFSLDLIRFKLERGIGYTNYDTLLLSVNSDNLEFALLRKSNNIIVFSNYEKYLESSRSSIDDRSYSISNLSKSNLLVSLLENRLPFKFGFEYLLMGPNGKRILRYTAGGMSRNLSGEVTTSIDITKMASFGISMESKRLTLETKKTSSEETTYFLPTILLKFKLAGTTPDEISTIWLENGVEEWENKIK